MSLFKKEDDYCIMWLRPGRYLDMSKGLVNKFCRILETNGIYLRKDPDIVKMKKTQTGFIYVKAKTDVSIQMVDDKSILFNIRQKGKHGIPEEKVEKIFLDILELIIFPVNDKDVDCSVMKNGLQWEKFYLNFT